MEQSKTVKQQNLTLSNRSRLALSGIDDVEAFTETVITVVGVDSNIVIAGENLKIEKFNKGEGTLELTGRVDSIRYTAAAEKRGFLKRLLK